MRYVLISSLALLFCACTYFPPPQSSGREAGEGEQPRQIVLPEAQENPPLVVEKRESPPEETDYQSLATDYVPEEETEEVSSRGWRVQLFTTKSSAAADSFAREVENRLDMAVYKIYVPPFYKVRIGDCTSRNGAEELESEAIKKGYETFIVRDVIEIEKGEE